MPALKCHCEIGMRVGVDKQALDSSLALASGQAVCKLCKGWNKFSFSIPKKKLLQVATNGNEKAVSLKTPHHWLQTFEIVQASKEAVIFAY